MPTLELAIRATAFAAVGTAGQRCTTARRLIVHESIHDAVLERLVQVYSRVKIGDPWDESVLMGPLISEQSVEAMMAALDAAREQGGEVVHGGERLARPGFFVDTGARESDAPTCRSWARKRSRRSCTS